MPDNQIGSVELINLNEKTEQWYLLALRWDEESPIQFFHLENPYPDRQFVRLPPQPRGGIEIVSFAQRNLCPLWADSQNSELHTAQEKKIPFAPICAGRLLLRNHTEGKTSTKEHAVSFLRNNVWQGENFINLLKDTVYKDSEIIEGNLVSGSEVPLKDTEKKSIDLPIPALLSKESESQVMKGQEFGITRKNFANDEYSVGQWYESEYNSGIFVSTITPEVLPLSLQSSFPKRTLPFDPVESKAAVFLVAFDLEKFDIGYSTGTNHPEVKYSERAVKSQKVDNWGGPDGFENWKPLVATGVMNPILAGRAVATFTGGFKRKHSIFRYGKLAKNNGGTHYGFMQNGTIFSTLHSGLATAIIYRDGSFALKTWSDLDTQKIDTIQSARQNGLPLMEYSSKLREFRPGPYVKNNALGNWSGNKKNEVRALRSAVCWQKTRRRNYLIYGYFSSHTPNALAKVFMAYRCQYGMHMDMNMTHHTYLALYKQDRKAENIEVQHIVPAMNQRDQQHQGKTVPRFVGLPDNRDFFYLMRKENKYQKFLVNRPLNMGKKLKIQQFIQEQYPPPFGLIATLASLLAGEKK